MKVENARRGGIVALPYPDSKTRYILAKIRSFNVFGEAMLEPYRSGEFKGFELEQDLGNCLGLTEVVTSEDCVNAQVLCYYDWQWVRAETPDVPFPVDEIQLVYLDKDRTKTAFIERKNLFVISDAYGTSLEYNDPIEREVRK